MGGGCLISRGVLVSMVMSIDLYQAMGDAPALGWLQVFSWPAWRLAEADSIAFAPVLCLSFGQESEKRGA